MFNALKRLGKKTLMLIGFLICFPILIIVFLVIVRGCSDRKISYSKYEEKMISAFESYINKENKIPASEGEIFTLPLSTLVEEGYIKSPEKLLGDSTCDGSVSVRRNGASIENNNGGFLSYTADLNCKEYQISNLAKELKKNLVTYESGLYEVGNEYIFKGNKPNNYITFFGESYRIVSMDKTGILKLVKSTPEMVTRIWDNKFNVETNSNSGKNIYKDSRILEFLEDHYNNVEKISEDAKKTIVARDACIGKRNNQNYSIDKTIDCSEKLNNQVISLLNISDYAMASLDSDCTTLISRSCNNYNYLYDVAASTWTLNSSLDNTYEVISLSGGLMEVQTANMYNQYNIVIYIDGNHIKVKGDGTLNSPYVIE